MAQIPRACADVEDAVWFGLDGDEVEFATATEEHEVVVEVEPVELALVVVSVAVPSSTGRSCLTSSFGGQYAGSLLSQGAGQCWLFELTLV
ncbi:Methyltransferase type 11 [Neofusicoccum parvum]|uniref:Methyltransferase type 11 n=1 Tax=Neofusicoccum parvum TaxID=310453 RepID=A0ACB5S9R8_9PEZI|nr:Methyltransferase type 11 [Neofusicoccum parvum]